MKIDAEDLNQKFINNLTSQLETFFTANQDGEDGQGINSTRSLKKSKFGFDDDLLRSASLDDEKLNDAIEQNLLVDDENGAQQQQVIIEEKEKFLDSVKNSVKQMQSELVELMKHEYVKNI